MSLQSLKLGTFFPPPKNTQTSNVLLIDASGEKASHVVPVPKTQTISKVVFKTDTVTTSQTIRVSLQTLSGGNPTGTLYGGSAAGTQTSPASSTVYVVALGTGASATAGDHIGVVFEFDSTVGNLRIGCQTSEHDSLAFPYCDLYTGSWAKQARHPVLALEYSDGSYEPIPGAVVPVSSSATNTYNSGSSPDERALRALFPFPVRVRGGWISLSTLAALDMVLYEGTSALESKTIDTANYSGSGGVFFFEFSTPRTLTKNTEYFLSAKPTSGSNISMLSYSYGSDAIMNALPGGQDLYWGERTDGSSWTTTTTKRPNMGLWLDQFDDGVGGAAGIKVHPGMDGGFRG